MRIQYFEHRVSNVVLCTRSKSSISYEYTENVLQNFYLWRTSEKAPELTYGSVPKSVYYIDNILVESSTDSSSESLLYVLP